jgi:hypothetical protein
MDRRDSPVKFLIDWKFLVGSILAVLGLVIPLYLWQVDLSSHSLSLRLVSSSALQPVSSAQFQDLQVTLNGTKITTPYLSSFEMINTGSKPILSSDFESSIEVQGLGNVRLITAQVTGTDPKEIPIKVSVESNRLTIAPFLSNPNDIVSFSVITGEEPPVFKAKARIAGIKEVVLEDASTKKGRPSRLIFSAIFAVLGITLYLRFALETIYHGKVTINRPTSFFIFLTCGAAGVTYTTKTWFELSLFSDMWTQTTAYTGTFLVACLAITLPLHKWWKRERVRRRLL